MTIKKTLIGAASVTALALAVAAAPAAADGYAVESAAAAAPASDAREFSWSITVGGTSDYIFRGLSFTNEDPAAQGSIDFSYGIFYAGAWASNIDNGSYEPWELDLYVGMKPTLGPVTFDFAVIGYLYPADSADLDYIELKAGASMEIFKSLTGGVTFYYSPDSDNYSETWTVEGSLAYALPQVGIFTPTVSGLVGYSSDEGGICPFYCGANSDLVPGDAGYVEDYVYWNAGLALTVEKFTMDFRYWDTDISSEDSFGLADERFVFTAKVTLP
jgi:uncharacterized protein (TIGR02001 family)